MVTVGTTAQEGKGKEELAKWKVFFFPGKRPGGLHSPDPQTKKNYATNPAIHGQHASGSSHPQGSSISPPGLRSVYPPSHNHPCS